MIHPQFTKAYAIRLALIAALFLGLTGPYTSIQAQTATTAAGVMMPAATFAATDTVASAAPTSETGTARRAAMAQARAQTAPHAPAATTITVTRSDDPTSDSITKTCGYTAGIYQAVDDGCTLRRALVEAGARPADDRPIAIEFNLADDDPAHDAAGGTWMLAIDAPLRLKPESILDKDGRVTIDGDTQPGGRTAGPTIYVDTNDHSLEIELENNVITNLGFIGGGVIFLKEDGNVVEGVTMGLAVDGQSIVLRDPANPDRLAGGGIHVASDNNEIAANTIAGAYAPAITIDGGDNNLVELNYIGTRADGTVPDVPAAIRCLRSFSYDPSNWYGGWGINLSGSNNDVSRNLIAGLHILQSANDTPPRAIEIFGSNHRITENIIGADFDDSPAGVCGQGIKVSGSDTLIADNMITGSRLDSEDAEPAAILASDTSPLFGQITVRGNLVEDGPGKVYGFGPGIPDALRLFAPAAVTDVTATTISGSSGADSPCPNCEIDVYLDNLDDNQEALVYAGSATADADGNWSLAIPQPVPANAGIRTAGTTTSSGVIGTYGAGTSTKLSGLYVTPTNVIIAGPSTGDVGTQYQFDITTTPATTEAIYDYTVTVTDFDAPLTGRFSSLANARLTWSEPGVKTIEVRVETALGAVTTGHTITIAGNDPDPTPTPDPTPDPTPEPGSSGDVYLPLVHRP